MLQDIYNNTKEYMQKSLQSLQKDFATLRSGRVSVNILDNIRVDYYTDFGQYTIVLIITQSNRTIIV